MINIMANILILKLEFIVVFIYIYYRVRNGAIFLTMDNLLTFLLCAGIVS